MNKREGYGIQTMLAHLGDNRTHYCGAVVPPIFETSLFTFESYEAAEKAYSNVKENYIYTRGLNPTVQVVETKMAELEKGGAAKCFSSGMAAISSSLLSMLKAGDHAVCVKNVYGPAYRFLAEYLSPFKIDVTFVNGENTEEFEKAIRKNTRVFYLESPASFTFTLQNIADVVNIARRHNIKTIIDNSYSSPIFQNPLEFGADIVVHSASKYLCGHSDIIAGAVVSSKENIDRICSFEQALLGGIIGPFEAWLLLRGLRTLELRMERHMRSALEVAAFLERHPKIKSVNYPGLASHPQYELACRQMKGFSGLMSFELNCDENGIKRFINSLRYFKIGVSWGGFESLVFAPLIGCGRDIPGGKWKEPGSVPDIVRISVGLEEVEDLIADLEQALVKV